MRALPIDGDVRAYGHVAHRKQRRCRAPRSSSLYRSLPLAFSWARAMWATSHTHHVISQPRPSPFLRRYHLPRKSKRARNGEGLGPRLAFWDEYTVLCMYVYMCRDRGRAPISRCARFRMGTRTHIIAEVYIRVGT